MTSPTAAFFDDLGRRGHEPLLAGATGTVRVEISDGGRVERWCVAIERGNLTVSAADGPVGCTLRADRRFFDDLVRGRANPIASVLRGALDVEGEWALLLLFQRLFPASDGGPAAAGAPEGAA